MHRSIFARLPFSVFARESIAALAAEIRAPWWKQGINRNDQALEKRDEDGLLNRYRPAGSWTHLTVLLGYA